MKPAANRPWQQNPEMLVVQADGMLGAARVLHQARDGIKDDPRLAHLCLDAGQSRVLSGDAGTTADRVLAGWLIAIFACACLGAVLMQTGNRTALATAQMERLAEQTALTTIIPARTAAEIARALEQPSYDCAQVPCESDMQARNQAVRDHLRNLLATKEVAAQPAPLERFVRSRREANAFNPH